MVDQKEHDIDFRVPGLSHCSCERKQNISEFKSLVKRIETHPHREAFHADLQQNNVYNPFSKNSKEMIRELGNVELFELCETLPKVQCSHCLLYWNQGIVYCICGGWMHSPSRTTWQRKGRNHAARQGKTKEQTEYHMAWECVEEMLQEKLTLKVNISQVFTIDFSEIQLIVNHNSINRMDRTKVQRDGRTCEWRPKVLLKFVLTPFCASVSTSELTLAVGSEVDRAHHNGYGGRQPRAGYKYWASISCTVSSRIGTTRRKSCITRFTMNSGLRMKNIPFCPRKLLWTPRHTESAWHRPCLRRPKRPSCTWRARVSCTFRDARRTSRWTLVTACRTERPSTKVTLCITPPFAWLAVIIQSISWRT